MAIIEPFEQQVMGAVDQPVKDALSQDRVGEEVIPVLGGAVGGHYYGAPTAALRNTLIEILCLLGIEGGETGDGWS